MAKGLDDLDDDSALRMAAALERRSEHPVARALQRARPEVDADVREYFNRPGHGVTGISGSCCRYQIMPMASR